MILVDDAALFPAECIVDKTATGPFVDTQIETRAGERIYICVERVRELAKLIGYEDASVIEELTAAKESAEERLAELEVEDEALRQSVRRTLDAGAVEVRDGELRTHKLRPLRGQKAVKV